MSSSTIRWTCWLAPVVMVAVAVGQHVAVREANLTPWRGGGFGMFATVDSPKMRVCRIYLDGADGVGRRGQIPPALQRQWIKVQAMPTPARVAALAQALAAETWVPENYDPFGVVGSSPAGGREQVSLGVGLYRAVAPGEPTPSSAQTENFVKLRLEVLRCQYNRFDGRMTVNALEEATVPF